MVVFSVLQLLSARSDHLCSWGNGMISALFSLKPWLSGLHGKGSESGMPYIIENGKKCAP